MITALVQFKLPQPVTREKARELFSATAPRYREVPGLIRKYYLLSQDGGSAGGVYLFESREDAERLYSAEWKKTVQERYWSAAGSHVLREPGCRRQFGGINPDGRVRVEV